MLVLSEFPPKYVIDNIISFKSSNWILFQSEYHIIGYPKKNDNVPKYGKFYLKNKIRCNSVDIK